MHQQVRQFVSDASNSRHRFSSRFVSRRIMDYTRPSRPRKVGGSRTVLLSRHYIPWMDRIIPNTLGADLLIT